MFDHAILASKPYRRAVSTHSGNSFINSFIFVFIACVCFAVGSKDLETFWLDFLKGLQYGSQIVQSRRIALKCICPCLTGVSESGP